MDVENSLSGESSENLIERAETNLNRQLEWSGRYDARIAFITSLALAMLGVVTAISAPLDQWSNVLVTALCVAVSFLVGSLLCVYFGLYPKIDSAHSSVIFFSTIAEMSVGSFKKRFLSLSDAEYLEDILTQIHINSEILKNKFFWLKAALVLLLLAVIPSIIVIYTAKLIP